VIQNQQPGEDTRAAITEPQKELDDIKKKYSDLERIHKYTAKETASETGSCCTALFPQFNVCKILKRCLYEANKLVEKQQEEIRTLMNHVKLLEEEKIKNGIYYRR